MTTRHKTLRLIPVLALLAAGSASATNGYFPHGYGMKAKGMGGASVASTDNAFGGANNPAAAAWAGNRFDAGLDIFMPVRSVERSGSAAGLNGSVESDGKSFLVPELGYNRTINNKMGVGVTVYGNGGMNTDFAGGQIPAGRCGPNAANLLCGSGKVGIDMMQLIVAPTIGYKLSDAHSVGVSPLFIHQRFKADGLQMFSSLSASPANVSGNGYDSSNGLGVRLGYLGKIGSNLSLGASFSPRTKMSKFSKYAGLFADSGSFDIPANYTVGVNWQASSAVNVAVDYERIQYSGVKSVGSPSTNAAPLGSANGPGFGWSDVNVWKLGAQWQMNPQWVLRAGLNVGSNPVQSRDITFNMVAPGVITKQYTVGATYSFSPSTELSFAYMMAPNNSVSGSSLFNGFMGGMAGNETVRMKQSSLGVAMSFKF